MTFLCTTEQIPEGEGRGFEIDLPGNEKLQVLIVHYNDQFFAYENACAHFGVRLDVTPDYRFLQDGDIVCQVHYARYEATSGACIRGDCNNEGLKSLQINLVGSEIHLSL